MEGIRTAQCRQVLFSVSTLVPRNHGSGTREKHDGDVAARHCHPISVDILQELLVPFSPEAHLLDAGH